METINDIFAEFAACFAGPVMLGAMYYPGRKRWLEAMGCWYITFAGTCSIALVAHRIAAVGLFFSWEIRE